MDTIKKNHYRTYFTTKSDCESTLPLYSIAVAFDNAKHWSTDMVQNKRQYQSHLDNYNNYLLSADIPIENIDNQHKKKQKMTNFTSSTAKVAPVQHSRAYRAQLRINKALSDFKLYYSNRKI